MAQLLMPGSVVAMTDQAADRLLKLDSGDAALLYLHLLRWGTPDGLSVRRSGRPGRPRGGPAPGVWGGGYHRRPQRPGLHLPGPGR